MELSTEIKRARAKLGLSQPQAAKMWGITLITLQSWEQGIRTPRGLAMTKLREIIATAMAAKPAAREPSESEPSPASAAGSPRRPRKPKSPPLPPKPKRRHLPSRSKQ